MAVSVWSWTCLRQYTTFRMHSCTVQEGIYDDFVDAVTKKVGEFKQGGGLDPSTTLGPLIGHKAVEHVRIWPPELPAPSLLMLWALLLPHTHTSAMDGVTAISSLRLEPGCYAAQFRARSAFSPHPGNALWQALTDVLMLVLLQVSGHVEDAVAKGAKVTIGGKIPDLPEPYNKVSLYPGAPAHPVCSHCAPDKLCAESSCAACMHMCGLTSR